MTYSKPPMTYEEQADILIGRGLIADRDTLISRLRAVNYYRLSGYLHTYRLIGPDGKRQDEYRAGTALDEVWNRYCFDRQLRLAILDGIERIEVAMKTQLTYVHSHGYGPFGYLNPGSLPRLSPQAHSAFVQRVVEETGRSREDFVGHFFEKYGDSHRFLPLWMAVEIMSFGSVLTIFHGMAEKDLKGIARGYGLNLPLLDSWVTALNGVRNLCAHHARVWNRELGSKPKIPYAKEYPSWHFPVPTPPERIFSILTIEKYFLDRIAPQSRWSGRLKDLLASNPDIPTRFMGFPDNWQDHGVWASAPCR
jgi:abortive infection bacteriophage resistance protein